MEDEVDRPKITRVMLKNFKSIAACDVRLGDLTVLVGQNGSGKSNFVDSLRFVADALTTTLDHALRDRGGINEVRRRSNGHPTHFGVRLELVIPGASKVTYAFEIAAKRNAFAVKQEQCLVFGEAGPVGFERSAGSVKWHGLTAMPAVADDRLLLVSASGLPELRPMYDALTGVGAYSLNPDVLRALQQPDAGELLARDGSNLASVLGRLDRDRRDRIQEYLAVIVPGITEVAHSKVGPMETLEFRQLVAGAANPWRFLAQSMSDGTLRSVGILAALFQSGSPLVAIEEPEIALHPAAAEALYDALSEASRNKQVLVTSHSPELLDNPSIQADQLRAVENHGGETSVGEVSDADREALALKLYTAGELLRIGQIAVASSAKNAGQLNLFADA